MLTLFQNTFKNIVFNCLQHVISCMAHFFCVHSKERPQNNKKKKLATQPTCVPQQCCSQTRGGQGNSACVMACLGQKYDTLNLFQVAATFTSMFGLALRCNLLFWQSAYCCCDKQSCAHHHHQFFSMHGYRMLLKIIWALSNTASSVPIQINTKCHSNSG